MTRFKAKLFKLGNSRAIYIPKSIYKELELKEYEWEVYTEGKKEAPKVYTPQKKVLTNKSSRMEMCPKHPGSMKITCGCK